MTELTAEQRETVEKFRQLVGDELPAECGDWYLVRWLRARNFHLKNAEKMFRASMSWRREFELDRAEEWEAPAVLRQYMPGGHIGYDREGCPIWVDLAPKVDWSGVVRSVKKRDILKETAIQMEAMSKLHQKGKRDTQIVFILDLTGLGTRQLKKDFMDLFNDMTAQSEANYPEFAKTIFVYNAPRIFPLLYSLARPFLSEDTTNKIKILGSDYKEELLKHIAPDQLPAYLGGTLTGPDGDIYCKHLIKQGGEIPQECYLKGTGSAHTDGRETTRATIHPGGTLQLACEAPASGSVIKWSFETEDYDLAFGIYLKETENPENLEDMRQVLGTTRVNSHLVPEDGYFTCPEAGSYVFVLDNSYSWVYSKEVEYVVEVVDFRGSPSGIPRDTSREDPVHAQVKNLSLRDTPKEDEASRDKILNNNDALVNVPI